MKIKVEGCTVLGPWHLHRIFLPKRLYDGRIVWRGCVARRRVLMAGYSVGDSIFFDEGEVAPQKRWQYADINQVLALAP